MKIKWDKFLAWSYIILLILILLPTTLLGIATLIFAGWLLYESIKVIILSKNKKK